LRAGRLRLRRHHRGLRRPLASRGHGVLGHSHEHVLYRRRAGAIATGPAQVADRGIPGPAAVHAAGLRHAGGLPPALRARAGGRRAHRPRGALMDSYALLIAATLNAGTVLALASLGLLINEKS